MENKKIFCGSGRKKNDTWLQITINPEKIKDYIQEFKGSKYVKLNINIGQADKFGKDVQVTIDQFNPQGHKQDLSPSLRSDLPF